MCEVDHNESSKSNKASHDEESSVANSDKLKNISDSLDVSKTCTLNL